MRMFISYLAARWRVLALFVVFTAVFLVLFFLYQLPVSAVAYGFLLCTFIGLIALFFDFSSFREKRRVLQGMLNEVTDTLEHLPPPQNGLEADYQALLRTLFEERRQLRRKLTTRYADTVEYYTMWVHQIKNPIAAMRLLLQNEEGAQTAELQEELQRIEQYVEMVLTYLRLDAHSTDYVIREYDLDRIVRQAVRKYASQFIRKKIHLEYEPLGVKVLTDEKWLLFVVEQLLSNALKYTKSGSVTIRLEAPKTLCIADTGIGIAPEDVPRIFEKGYTGYNGREDKRSSGIGLYLCKRICRNLHHGISAQSAPGSGTVVRLELDSAQLEVE